MSDRESVSDDTPPEHIVLAYHERTKHHFHRYAASPGYMDWATQPDPFRRFDGADVCVLPLPDAGDPQTYDALFTPGAVRAEPLSVLALSRFLRYALSITAWKEAGATSWALRANPSSGNLHPTEGYLVLPALAGVADVAGLYHYAPRAHALERRARLDELASTAIFGALPPDAFIVGLSSIHWREAWKYGERAFRYCQHDVGHALATLRMAAACQGWHLTVQAHLPHAVVARMLGLDRASDFDGAEREEPDLLAIVTPGPMPTRLAAWSPPDPGDGARWSGRANALSHAHTMEWPVIDEVSLATERLAQVAVSESCAAHLPEAPALAHGALLREVTAEQVIVGRRSAQAMDGITSVAADDLFRMLVRLLPMQDERAVPWDAISWRPRIHLVLFVHRVTGLASGLYCLVRDLARLGDLKAAMRPDFAWQPVDHAPQGLPLFLLQQGDCRALAARLSCGQTIAADGAFSLGMLADFTLSLARYGAPFYRNLFWESGMIGQVLYLEAEAAGVRGTGIGCFFDDPVHEVCGFTSRDWQSLYHFTVGGSVNDTRLTTRPGYSPDEDRR